MTHDSATEWLTWEPWPYPGFERFKTTMGMRGLARIGLGRLDVLALDATKPGTGQFRAFIIACQETFRTVRVWEVWNPIVAGALHRYGFRPSTGACLPDAPDQECWLWVRP